jgi:hypothetical protein
MEQRLTVKSLTGTAFVLVVDLQCTTVAEVKAMVADRQGGIPVNQQRLIYGGQELEGQHSLRHYGIANESFLVLVELTGPRGEALPGNPDGLDVGRDDEAAVRSANAKLQDEVLAKSLEIDSLKRELQRKYTIEQAAHHGGPGVTALDALRDHAPLVGAARIAAAEVEKQRSAFAQAVDRDRLSAEALGWCQGLAPAHERPYYFHTERPNEVLFSVEDLCASIDAQARALREAELEKLADEHGPLFADIERCISIRAAQTVEQENAEARSLARAAAAAATTHEAAVLAAAIPASRSEEADALEEQASEARDAAASSHAEASCCRCRGEFAAAVPLKAEAGEAEKRASELDKRALQCRAEAAERTIGARARAEAEAEAEVARVAARRDNFYLPASLQERCTAEVARLQACRDSSVDAGDYEAAGQHNANAKAYASLVPKLQGLAWMQWKREDTEAARAREEVESLRRHKLATTDMEVEARCCCCCH